MHLVILASAVCLLLSAPALLISAPLNALARRYAEGRRRAAFGPDGERHH